MLKIDHQQILKRYYQLPRSLQEAMFSERSADTIGKTCILREAEEYTAKIAALTGRVLLGYLRPETFAFEIQKEAGIDALKATQVAHDIDTEIFSGVRLELKKLYPPTIQTPTVQAQGFTPRESGTGFQDLGFKIQEQKPAPRYVVPIPEKFKGTSAWPIPKANEIVKDLEVIEAKEAVVAAPILKTTIANEADAPVKANEAISYKLKVSEGPPMDPIVPLPTFIQSKFKASELGVEAGIRSAAAQTQPETKEKAPDAPSAQDALKSAFGKFTTSSTATGVAQEPVSPYRESVEEQKPAAKVQGKVIDLSRF